MVKINCWNEYDNLKTIILGSVYELDKIPQKFTDKDQENFIKIIEDAHVELNEFQKILEQNNVKVYRPKQPKTYNGLDLPFQDHALNMRDQYLAYGNILFSTYMPYMERRFTHLWLEEIFADLIKHDNLIVNMPEFNFDDGIFDKNAFVDFNQFFELENFPHFPKTYAAAKNIEKYESIYDKNVPYDWFKKHHVQFGHKTHFHMAFVLKNNNQAYVLKYGNKKPIGHMWFENWLATLGVTPTYIPRVGHLDASVNILNEDTVVINSDRFNPKVVNIDEYFKNFKNKIYVNIPENRKTLPREFYLIERYNPTSWLEKWKPICDIDRTQANCVSLSPNKVCCNFYNKKFYDDLKNVGIEPIYIQWSHPQFLEGNLHCITCDIERRLE